MSHSSSATVSLSTTQPLSDILPWGSPLSISQSAPNTTDNADDNTTHNAIKAHNRTLLITDSISADGRFILHTLALQFLSSRYMNSDGGILQQASSSSKTTTTMEGAVLWITLSPLSERQVVMALRKGMQHNLNGAGSSAASVTTTASGGNTMGSSAAATSGGRIHVVSVPLELADIAIQQHCQDEEKQSEFSHESYLRQLHQRIRHWLNYRELLSPSQCENSSMQQTDQQQSASPSSIGPNLVIIDNGTMLSTMFGDQLSTAFLSSVRATLTQHSRKSSTMGGKRSSSDHTNTTAINTTNLLTIRTTSPDDGGLYQLSDEDTVMKGEKLRSEYSRLLRPWLGMGSGPSSGGETNIVQMEEQASYLSLSSNSTVPSMVYRCGLYELADGIVDVSPLESGYARDVLGRLSFATTWSGKGWWGGSSSSSLGAANPGVGGSVVGGSSSRGAAAANIDNVNGSYSSLCVNYRCDDSGVRVMRLRSR